MVRASLLQPLRERANDQNQFHGGGTRGDRTEANRVIAMPAIREQLIKLGIDPASSTPAEFLEVIKRDIPLWRDRVKAAGLPYRSGTTRFFLPAC